MYSTHSSPKAISAEIRPISMPSMINGILMKVLVAPTRRIMPISLRREKMVILMVLAMITTETIARMTTMTLPMVEMARSISERMVASWLGVRMSGSIPSICSSWSSTLCRVDSLTSFNLMR